MKEGLRSQMFVCSLLCLSFVMTCTDDGALLRNISTVLMFSIMCSESKSILPTQYNYLVIPGSSDLFCAFFYCFSLSQWRFDPENVLQCERAWGKKLLRPMF